ncbi:cytoskeletal protein binding protein [Malassezia nana]|uniref:Actin cytoskeleton-regulatory complex protein SLA1 n=1 Tax=Malassezia nana TaxID=180528 RepID=A0AAF0ENQ7_9BASI|nr:cytoskeletal protein binding protein [Malassezia nana]
MVRLGIAEAQYDYTAQADDELSIAEGDVLYVDDVLDGTWCRARHQASGATGLVPANYIEMRAPLRLAVAAYAYEAQNEDELTISEAQPLDILETEGDWLLARTQPPAAEAVGLVPANYVEEAGVAEAESAAPEAPLESVAPPQVDPPPQADPPPAEPAPVLLPPPTRKVFTPVAPASPIASPRVASAEQTRAASPVEPVAPSGDDDLDAADGQASNVVPPNMPAASTAADVRDEIRMWSVTHVDAKKRKRQSKGTLGVGHGSVFYATEQDGASVPSVRIQDVQSWTLEKNKYLVLTINPSAKGAPPTLVFHVGSRDAFEAIRARLEYSRSVNRAATRLKTPAATGSSSTPARRLSESEMVVVLYDFEAQDHDELSVSENDQLYLIERENNEWWKLQSASGRTGVVPASYVKLLNQPPSPSLVALDLKMRTMPAEEPRTERAVSKPSAARMRTWVDATGKFRVDAELVGVQGNTVRLHKANGAMIDVPLFKMSRADLLHLESVTGRRLFDEPSPSNRRESMPASRPPESAARKRQAQRPHVDWFEFFLDAGVDVDHCSRYASSFERDHVDESILVDLDASVLRSLGLKEGDILRVRRYIQQTYGASAPPAASPAPSSAPVAAPSQSERERQAKEDEALARRLQAQEIAAQRRTSDRAPRTQAPPGEPAPASTPDPDLAPAPARAPAPDASPRAPAALAPAPTGVDAATIAAAVEIVRQREREEQEAREAEAKKKERKADPNSELFDKLERLKPAQTPASAPALDPNAPRGPLAPVPLNQSLLQPLIPLQGTGQFVPTQATGMGGQVMGFPPQPTGFGPSPFMSQPTGFMSQPTGFLSQPTGMVPQPPQPPTLGAATAETTASTNAQERFSAANVFEQMKTGAGAFGNRDTTAPQSSGKYDALRAQPTGFAAGGIVESPASSPFGGGFVPMGTMPGYHMPTGYYS